jgi:signal transduction histidine kinase/ActR/RegA family two-component response regulator
LIIPSGMRGEVEQAIRQMAETGQPIPASEMLLMRKDGSPVAVFSSHAIVQVPGREQELFCIDIDLTERMKAEEEKRRLEERLQRAEKMEAIGTLAGGIAHDFNNVLAAIIGYTEMAMAEGRQEARRQYLQQILKGTERATEMVRQILTFSRRDSQEKKPLDAKLLLKESLNFLRASIPATIEIRQHIPEESCNIMADPTQIDQIIMNLCTNAAHAMKQNGGILTIKLSAVDLYNGDVTSHPDLKPGHYVRLTVSDTGHGIDPVLQNRIFDPFFTTKSKEEGTGLGLSVVYGIVNGHEGAISVYSEPERGASFSVYLPRIIHEEIAGGNLSACVVGGAERILFVDDETALVDIATSMLSTLGYAVTGVASSTEALDLFRAGPQRFDLVMTDMTLPKMTGIDLSREILQIRPDIPIILCSGIREAETEKQVQLLGIRAYCIKPLTMRELSGIIRDTLDKHSNHLDHRPPSLQAGIPPVRQRAGENKLP